MNNFINADSYELIKTSIPIVCVDLLIVKNGKVLLLKRKNATARGQWWYPGGRIFKNETIFDAAKRKGMEEIGILLEPRKIISVEESIFTLDTDEVDIHTINIVTLMKFINSDFSIKLDENHSEFKWFSEINVPLHPAVRNPLEKINYKFNCE